MESEKNEQHSFQEEVRTSMHCHNCSKGFLALLDHRIDGTHIIECPHCAHQHYRAVKAGVVTEVRWGSDLNTQPVKARKTWKHDSLHIKSTTASDFIRNRWLNLSQ